MVLYIKHGVGAKALFEDIQDGVLVAEDRPMITPTGQQSLVQQNPAAGGGVRMAQRTTTASQMARPTAPTGPMVRPPMMPQLPPGAQVVNTKQGPMIMVPNPQGGQPNFFRPPVSYGQAPYAAPMMPNVATGRN